MSASQSGNRHGFEGPPKTRVKSGYTSRRDQQILCNVVGSEAQLLGLGAFSLESAGKGSSATAGCVVTLFLGRMHFLEQRVRVEPVPVQVISQDLNINGSWQAEIQNLADHIRRQESELDARELRGQRQPELLNVIVGGMVIRGQRDKNVSVRCPYWGRGAIRKVNAAVG